MSNFIGYIPSERNAVTPKLLISTQGKMTFNQASVKEWGLDKYDYVKVYYDEDTGDIGFKFFKKSESDSVKGILRILRINKSNGIYIYSTSFLKHFNIDYSKRSERILKKGVFLFVASNIVKEKTKLDKKKLRK